MKKRSSGWLLAVGMVYLLTPHLQARAAVTVEGRLVDVKGDVEIKKRGGVDWIEAYNKVPVGPGDIISTGIDGRARILFKNSETKIFPLTQFVMGRSVRKDTEMYTEIFLLAGKVSTHVIKTMYTGIANNFNVITPTAMITGHGTIETVEYNSGMGTRADIRDGKGYAAPIPVEKLPPAVLELLGIIPDTFSFRNTPDTMSIRDTGLIALLKSRRKTE